MEEKKKVNISKITYQKKAKEYHKQQEQHKRNQKNYRIVKKKHRKAKRAIFFAKYKMAFFITCIMELLVIILLLCVIGYNQLKQKIYVSYINGYNYPKIYLSDYGDPDYQIPEKDIPMITWYTHNKITKEGLKAIENGNYYIEQNGRRELIVADVVMDNMNGSRYYKFIVKKAK